MSGIRYKQIRDINIMPYYILASGNTISNPATNIYSQVISATTYYNLPTDIRVTGGTYSNGTILFTNNTGGTFNVTGLYTGGTDVFVTGATYSNNTFTYTNNTGGTFNVNFNTVTGLTVNGDLTVTGGTSFGTLTATTISATTISGGTIYANDFPQLPYTDGETIDYFISGSTTYIRVKDTVSSPSGGTRTFVGNVNVTSGLTANTISATTYYNLPIDVRVTGGTYTDGTLTFTNNTGGTFNVTGLYTGGTDVFVTGATYSNNTFTYTNNTGGTFNVNFNTVTGLTVNGNLTVTGNTSLSAVTATTISATTISGGTIYANDFPQLPYTDGETIDYFISGSTTYIRVKDSVAAPSGGTRTFVGNVNVTSGLTANTISATTYYNLPTDVRVTGGTYSNGTIVFTNNTGGTFNVTGLYTGYTAPTDVYVTGATYSNNTFTYTNNTGGTFNVSFNSVTGLTVNGDLTVTGGTSFGTLTATTISATTISGGTIYANDFPQLPYTDGETIDYFISGGTTYIRVKDTVSVPSGGTRTFVGNVNVTSGLTANTISATTYYNLPTDVRVTGGTYTNGTLTFTNNTGGTFNVTGLYTGYTAPTDVFVTGATYSNNTFTYTNNTGGTFNVNFNTVTGLTVNGNLNVTGNTTLGPTTATTISATTISGGTIYANDFPQLPYTDGQTIDYYTSGSTTYIRVKDSVAAPSGGTRTFVGNVNVTSGFTANTISATTYYNLPTDVRVTGGTYSNGTIVFTNNTGGTFNVTGLFSGGTDVYTTGGTYSNGTLIFTNNTGGTFNVTGLYTGGTDVFVTGATYSNNTFTYTNNTGGTFNVGFNTVTGLTVNGDLTVTGGTSFGTLTATTISATTISGNTIYANDFPQLPYTDGETIDYFVSGSTTYIRVKDSVAAPSGGTRTFVGNVNVTSGLTANTISATTYYNLPIDVRVTGGTYSNGTIVFTNNTGGTFNVTGLYTGGSSSTDVFVTGATYSNNTFTYTNNTGGTFNVSFNTVTGLTINGDLNVTGNTTLSSVSATTISATTYYNLPYSGNVTGTGVVNYITKWTGTNSIGVNSLIYDTGSRIGVGITTPSALFHINNTSSDDSFLVEDETNLDATPFVIKSDGRVGLGMTDPVAKLDIIAPALSGGSETLLRIRVSDDLNSGFSIFNATGADGIFVPTFLGENSTDKRPLYFIGKGATDTGEEPLVSFDARIGFNNPVVTRPAFSFTNYGTSLLYVAANGNTGIGTTEPLAKLHVNGTAVPSASEAIAYFTVSDDSNSYLRVLNGTGGDNSFVPTFEGKQGAAREALYFLGNGTTDTGSLPVVLFDARIGTSSVVTRPLYKWTNYGVDQMTMLANGYLGIGTSSPTERLHVSGNALISGGLTATTISATTYYNLPTDVRVTGGTYSNGTIVFTNNTGGTFNVIGLNTGSTFYGNVNYIDFNTTATTTHQEGRIHWNDNIKSLEIDTENANVQIQVGHQVVQRVYNGTGGVLTKGTVVYINGEQGQRPAIVKADYSNESTSASVIGMVMADINNGANGYIITNGILEGLNTLAYTAGTPLYLYTGGTYSSTKPIAPKHDVRIGKVVVSNATTGSIYVSIQNGYELEELHDVIATGATYGDLLVYSAYSGNNLWVRSKTLTGSYTINGDLSVTGNTTLSSVTATTISATTISGNTIYANDFPQLPYTDGQTIDYYVSGSTTYIRVKDSVAAPSGGTRTFVGNVNVTSGLTANTLNITTIGSGTSVTNLGVDSNGNVVSGATNLGFSPIPIATSSVAIGTGSNDYYLNVRIPYSLKVASVSFSVSTNGSDNVRVAIYRGQDTTATLVGQSSSAIVSTLNTFNITAEVGQNLSFTAGEWMVIAVAVGGTTTNLYGSSCPSNTAIAWFNATDSTGGFPTNPRSKTGTRTSFPSFEINVA